MIVIVRQGKEQPLELTPPEGQLLTFDSKRSKVARSLEQDYVLDPQAL